MRSNLIDNPPPPPVPPAVVLRDMRVSFGDAPPSPPTPPQPQPAAASGITKQELDDALNAVLQAFQATPADQSFVQRLKSRKLIATVIYEAGVLITGIAGGLPHQWAGIASIAGVVTYLLAQGITDAATMNSAPPPGTVNVPAPRPNTLATQ